MNLQSKCNSCGQLLTLAVDESYAALGDPANLLAAVVCNRCADLHERKHQLTTGIFDLCFALDRGVKRERLDRIRDLLATQTRKYAEVIALIQGNDRIIWDEGFPQLLFDNPDKCPIILRKYRKDCALYHKPKPKTTVTVSPPAVRALPYSDH